METTWLGLYIIEELNTNETTRLKTLPRQVFTKYVNEA